MRKIYPEGVERDECFRGILKSIFNSILWILVDIDSFYYYYSSLMDMLLVLIKYKSLLASLKYGINFLVSFNKGSK